MNFIQRWLLKRKLRSYLGDSKLDYFILTHDDNDHRPWVNLELKSVLKCQGNLEVLKVPHHGSHIDKDLPAQTQEKAGRGAIRALDTLRWLFVGSSRLCCEATAADLERDRKEMIRAGLSARYIRVCITWGALRSVASLLWDGLMSVLKKVAGAADLIRKIIGKR